MDGREGWDAKRGGALAYPVVRDRAGCEMMEGLPYLVVRES
jgi:hypothetical protein